MTRLRMRQTGRKKTTEQPGRTGGTVRPFLRKGDAVLENRYDDATFFEKYSQMTRSVRGLAGAGEWPALRQLLPDLQGKRVLDLGCGYGWHCIFAAEQGAKEVLGIDLSERMLQVARQKTVQPQVRYMREAIETFNCPPGSFDVVLSSLALHYVADVTPLLRRIADWLTPDGWFVCSVEHPIFTAAGSQDWYYDEAGQILHFPVDHYFFEGARTATFLGEQITKYHRTLTSWVDGILQAGFCLQRLIEPTPPESMLDEPGMRDELRRPMMLLLSAQKSQ